MKSWQKFKNDIKEDAPVNSMGSGGTSATGDTNVKSTGKIAGYDPVLGTLQRRKNPLDGRTKEFKKKVERLNKAREKRELVKLEKKYGIKLKG
tara:strand:- start:58 stop:336 length:279 start_codon:yes stop_codon:yes gene_type:complete